MTVPGFSRRWKDLPDYIVGITEAIWEKRGIESLNRCYAPDIPVRTPMGFARGNRAVIAATMATLHEFPDRQLYAEDVIWSGDPAAGFLSSHRIVTTGTHLADGAFGPATGRRFQVRVIADCAAKGNVVFDEWLVRDHGGIVRQLGLEPRACAAALIEREGGAERCAKPFTPALDEAGEYRSAGNDDERGASYASTVTRLAGGEFDIVPEHYDRAVQAEYPGAVSGISHAAVTRFWLGLRSSFPNAEFRIHHRIGMPGGVMPPRAALRWSLDGVHEGWGTFGEPSGASVHVMGMCHAEFGPFVASGSSRGTSVRRECVLYDEVAIWKQILMQRPELGSR